ncbi:TPA: hypothetical protein ACGD64_000467 [Serratia marcescens]|jgi:hypothetical protein|uniref:hypothetical protein n=1 Tax=Serratia TaxID=613 RepID=UPI0018D5AC85|nr:hypothetical protein [Serratia marcescens]MBH2667659.1 hypothetical protein [Serratia marcescens]MBH2672601.1 hypothetical protein [Serratia marcescens]MBH3057351.1 hypothetical protein [Serratia marcescens]MBH3302848.1 hypothetical protein [Serratia marcescens]MDP8796705.1 hypothetical protein [Serratia marcescens]
MADTITMRASPHHFNREPVFIAKVHKRERSHRTGKGHILKHHKVIWIQSFLINQHMIWAATGDLVNRFTPQAFGNINLGCAL